MRGSIPAFVITALWTAFAAQAQEPVQQERTVLKAETDKKDAVYRSGEKIKFLVSITDDGNMVAGREFKWSLSQDGGAAGKSGAATTGEKPSEIETALDCPGFALMTVSCKCDSGKDLRAMAGACADPMRISPGAPPPDDFKNFWDSKTDELKKLPLDVKMTPVDVPANVKGKIEAFDVKINCAGGAPVSGYYARPVGAAKKSLPAVMSYHGAGVRSSGLGTAIDLASRGSIAMDINAHGIENGKPKEFYDDLSKNELRDYRQRNSDDREKCYFLGMFQRVYRSLQFIKSQPEWDGKHLVTTGGSQGGGQSLVAAGLDPDVTLCAAYVPALCDHHGYMQKRKNGWPHFIQMKDGKAADPKVDAASAYFDCANFAPYIKARAILTVGFIDTTCCPSSVYAVYNSIKSPKEIINDPAAGHSVTKIMSDAVNGKINDYLKAAKAENSK